MQNLGQSVNLGASNNEFDKLVAPAKKTQRTGIEMLYRGVSPNKTSSAQIYDQHIKK